MPCGVHKPKITTTTYMEPTMIIVVISVLIFGISKAKRILNPHIPYRTLPRLPLFRSFPVHIEKRQHMNEDLFGVNVNVSLHACAAQLGFKPTWDH